SLFALLAFLFLLFALLSALAHCVKQRAFFLFQILLAVGPALLIFTAAMSLRAGATRNSARSTSADANVRELLKRSSIQRHHIEIILPGEIDVFLVQGKVCTRLSINRAGYLSPFAFA